MAIVFFLALLGLAVFLQQAALSLFLGIFLSYFNSRLSLTPVSVNGSLFLKAGIICLGGTISLNSLGTISLDYIPLVSIYVIAIMIFGFLIGKLIRLPHNLTLLLVSGTAICGGTAIASLAPIIKAKNEDLVASISLVFLLNAIAIILFPYIGEFFEMTDAEFGIFSALTIHDTASVVGTASLYSDESVTYASIIKLGRTLWIVPLLIGASIYSKSENKEYEFPYFILVFIAFVVLGNIFNIDGEIKSYIKTVSIAFFQIGLFMIGYKFQLHTLMKLSLKPVIFAASIWIIIILITLITFHA
ncbi:MAG: putative sulfate exporter family transporter [Gammaproteobacteria bacterium]|nr:putative sulfate exporter family transporter [Gammaproteobacteria bacterium]OUT93778.1 MAG: hypothetical protein CBB96_07190 [Gammaproteobacteria bacterium TMED36]|tara:strand:+ start:9337 stop:10242 length:906 start_codon:yes stop_codon:yes gene_type:complete